ncbi:MAG: hypothetical protein UU12_C0022G0004 [Candidatus Woesebacteria bacterium GW2011_GWA2_40_7b]|uniref:Uncharacterized protein n=1 Tax=Candidatus Woesebacteria bacterium GW2011_GWA2_40_7b TaxID=1618563 RepID=A0A0G0T051_9BACT|nr:MAG: hypothetical protein UU12_C0022G0004 [Candidatus Woesebacteria bacterium GW2011_GWA2_40_7b]KKS88033.1 MAG: hypothetical protein UV62_C0017G0008 [Parcubacteria group bacterium GW2011_GWC1_43_11]
MNFYLRFLLIWFINSVIILLANNNFGTNYVLGNAVMPPMVAGIFTGFLLTVLTKSFKPLLAKIGIGKKSRGSMFLTYWIINSVVIWALARLSVITGFGISAFYWAFALGLVSSLGQWLVRQVFKKYKLIVK